ncbi:MAG: DJ-1/PfpI family protein [Clostridiales bacterium]|nr:DJ-1/PfpI family protein [Clostridiales bacterium]
MFKVCVFLADGFEEVEGLTVVDLLRRADIETIMVSIMKTNKITGAHNIVVEADDLFENMDFSNFDGLILPGGMPGTKHLGNHKALVELLKNFNNDNKLVAAICAAPSVLGVNDILRDKKATCYPGFEDKLEGATFVDSPVVKDDNVITSRGVGTAIDFALEIIKTLKDEKVADEIAKSIIYKK